MVATALRRRPSTSYVLAKRPLSSINIRHELTTKGSRKPKLHEGEIRNALSQLEREPSVLLPIFTIIARHHWSVIQVPLRTIRFRSVRPYFLARPHLYPPTAPAAAVVAADAIGQCISHPPHFRRQHYCKWCSPSLSLLPLVALKLTACNCCCTVASAVAAATAAVAGATASFRCCYLRWYKCCPRYQVLVPMLSLLVLILATCNCRSNCCCHCCCCCCCCCSCCVVRGAQCYPNL